MRQIVSGLGKNGPSGRRGKRSYPRERGCLQGVPGERERVRVQRERGVCERETPAEEARATKGAEGAVFRMPPVLQP